MIRRFSLLLAQARYPTGSCLLTPDSFTYHNIITIAIGLEEFKKPIGMIASFLLGQECFCFLTKTCFLFLVLHLPGIEEIYPVDIGR